MSVIYLDNAATTQMDERVLDEMMPFFRDQYGNASSIHTVGREANVAVEQAREKIAHYIGVEPAQVIFTSGATESNNAVIKGVLRATGKSHVVSTPLEHDAVRHPLQSLADEGVSNSLFSVDEQGRIDSAELEKLIHDQTGLVSVMYVNNESGVVNPVSEMARICREKEIPFHSDTVQAFGKLPVRFDELGADFITLSGHKIHGPKGIGALILNPDAPWTPWMEGGSQERNRRGGTLNVPGIVGLGKALELACQEQEARYSYLDLLKGRLAAGLKDAFGDLVQINSEKAETSPHILNVSFPVSEGPQLDGEMLLLNLDTEDICVSNGSACTSGAIEPSHVLLATGMEEEVAKSSLRFSLSHLNSTEEMDVVVERLKAIIDRMMEVA